MAQVKPIPDGYHSVTPYLIIQGAAEALEFYKKAFSATERFRLADPKTNRIGHAEIAIGDSTIMLGDEHPEMGYRSPTSIGGTAVSIMLYVEDVDSVAKQALAAGAKQLRPVENQFYGDRAGKFEDPFGHVWTIATHIEDLTPEEVGKRAAAAFA